MRNFATVMAGQVGTWLLTAVVLLIVPRYLGASNVGAFNLGGTYGTVVIAVAGLGFAMVITRDVARDPAAAAAWLPSALLFQISLSLVLGACAIAIALMTDLRTASHFAIVVAILNVPFVIVNGTASAVFQGLERMDLGVGYEVAARVLTIAFVGLAILFDGGFYAVMLGATVPSSIIAARQLLHLRRLLPFERFRISWADASRIALASIPFFLVSVFFILYTATDVLLLSFLADERAVGLYSVPMRLFGTMLFIPSAIATVAFPRLSALSVDDRGSFLSLSARAMLFTASASGGMALGAAVMSDDALVGVLGRDFADSGPVILAVSASLVPTSLGTVAARVAFAEGRQKRVSLVVAAGFVAKVIAGVALINLFEARFENAALGAAVGLVVVELGMTAGMLALLPREMWDSVVLKRAAGFVVSLALGAAVLAAALLMTPGWVTAMLAMSTYAVALVVLQVHPIDELLDILRRVIHPRLAPAAP